MHFAWHAVVSTLPVAAGLSGASLQRWRRRLDAAAWGHKTSKDQCHRLAVPGGPPSPVGGRAQDAADGVALGPPEGVTGASCGYRYPQGVRRTSPCRRPPYILPNTLPNGLRAGMRASMARQRSPKFLGACAARCRPACAAVRRPPARLVRGSAPAVVLLRWRGLGWQRLAGGWGLVPQQASMPPRRRCWPAHAVAQSRLLRRQFTARSCWVFQRAIPSSGL